MYTPLILGAVGGLTLGLGYGANFILPSLPSSLQTGPLSSVGIFVIDYQDYFVLTGYALLIIAFLLWVL